MKSLAKAISIVFVLILFLFHSACEFSDSGSFSTEDVPVENAGKPHIKYAETTSFERNLHFEPNQGQSTGSAKFLTRGKGYSLFFESTEIRLLLQDYERNNPEVHQLRVKIEGANEDARIEGCDRLRGKSNYLIGNDPDGWHTDIPNYAKVKYHEVYSGIDLVYYGNETELEYDFIVRPKGDPKDITLKFDSEEKIRIDNQGNLVLSDGFSRLLMRAPVAYQQKESSRKPVKAHFRLLADNQVCFKVGKYDHDEPLVIDPVIVYSTYLGGQEYDYGNSIAVDNEGCVYVAGRTTSLDFPTEFAYQDELHPAMFSNISDVFVTKFSESGNSLIYSTFIGGRWDDEANGIAIDSTGRACITGRTSSNDDEETPEYEGYPLMNAYQTEVDPSFSKAFVTVLSPSGNSLEYSTYLGGKMEDWAEDIALDPSGKIYIVGTTFSSSFPTKNAFMPDCPSGYFDAFVAKFDPFLSGEASLVYSTYLGGDLDDWGKAIAVDPQGCAYVTGQCKSTDWPVTENAIQSSRVDVYEAFVSKISSSGTELEYSTYLGSEGTDDGKDIAVDSEGHAYVSGLSNEGFYTTPGAFNTTADFGRGFFSKLKTDGSGFEFSTHISTYNKFALGNDGTAYFIGSTRQAGTSVDIFIGDVYLLVLNKDASDTIYTYVFGGTDSDYWADIAVDNEDNIYVLGSTSSTDFPTLNAFQPGHNGKGETFITKLMPGEQDVNLSIFPDPIYFTMIPSGQVSREPVDVLNTSNKAIEISNIEVEPASMFALEEQPEFPVTLDPGGKLEIQIAFSPGGTKSAAAVKNSGTGTLTVVSDAENPITTVPIILSGIIVNLASDESDPYPSDGICDIDPGEDGFQVTLRAAIEHINAMGFDEETRVSFDIPGDGQPVIQVQNNLPDIKYPVFLDATTQDYGSVALDGSGVEEADYLSVGLRIMSGQTTIKGLHIRSFYRGGIILHTGQQNTITECEITENGNEEADNCYGILVMSGNNTISKNVISNNYKSGLLIIDEQASENIIEENMIGTEESGMHTEPNSGLGIFLGGAATHNYIVSNVISGNEGPGIALSRYNGKSPSQNVISQNFIGVAKDGIKRIGNAGWGISLWDQSIHNTLEYNVISGNHRGGVYLQSDENTINGNWIGTDTTGRELIPNKGDGILIRHANLNVIKQNTIGANERHGIHVEGDSKLKMPPLMNLITENHIGVGKKGYNYDVDLGNREFGVYMEYVIPSVINNDIADNDIGGIFLHCATEGMVENNKIYKNESGLALESSNTVVVNNSIFNNTQGITVDGYYPDGGSAIISLNDLYANGGDQTGIHITNGTVNVCGNFIFDDKGNAITVEGNSDASVTYNNIMLNVGYGLENLSDQAEVYAQRNFWGHESGPGGVGPGEGDMVSEGVDYANWLEHDVSVFVAAENDTIFAPIGRGDSLIIFAGDIDNYEDELGITVTDDLDWLTFSDYFEVETNYDNKYVDYLYFEIPQDVSEGTINRVDLTASSLDYLIDDFSSVFYIKAVDPVPEYYVISPDTIELEVEATHQFTSTLYDQFYYPSVLSSGWTCTGGTIEDGLYTAGSTAGIYEVSAEDMASGLKATAQVVIIPEEIALEVKPVAGPVAKHIRNIYPNPFKEFVRVNYYLDGPAHVLLKVYNMLGQEIEILENSFLPAGEYEAIWQANDLPGGMYFCRLQLGDRPGSSAKLRETCKLLKIE